MFGRWKLNQAAVICFLLALAVAAVYLPSVFLDFTNYDDPYYVTENLHVRGGLTWANVAWAFTHTCVANWQPVTLLSHALDCQIYGLNPAGQHLTSVILHGANTLVLFLLLRSMTGAAWRSGVVAALFALHPLHVESVAWISERKDVLSTLFGLLSLWGYAGYVNSAGCRVSSGKSQSQGLAPSANAQRQRIYYAMALAFFALGLMSKSMLVTWPCVMLLLDYWPLGRVRLVETDEDGKPDSRHWTLTARRLIPLVVEKLPFFALSIAMSVITFFTFREGKAVAALEDIPMGTRLISAAIAYIGYISKLIWPTALAPIYPRDLNWPISEMIIAPLLLLLITTLAIWQRGRRPYLLAGWAWYLGTLVPVIGLVQIGSHLMADRYTYIPAIGLMWIGVWAAADFIRAHNWRRTLVATAATGGLVACTIVAQRQLMYWQNTETLFRHTLAVTRNNYIAWSSLAFHYAKQHEAKQAEQCFRAALAIKPQSTLLLEALAAVLIDQGRYDEAIAQCQAALQLEPQMAAAHRTLGLALMKQGKVKEAINQYEESLRLEPEEASAHYNLANALARQGEYEKAREHYQQSVRLDPSSADAHNNLGYMLVRQNKLNDAISEFKAALALEPGSWHARYGLGDALGRQGKLKEAAKEFFEVLKIEPKSASAQAQVNRIAWILASAPDPQVRDGVRALELAEKVCELTSYTNAAVIETLAVARAETGRFAEAIQSAELARNLASSAGQNDVGRKAEELLELFRAGQPYRQGANPPPH